MLPSDLLFSQLSSSGMVYMKNSSYTEGMVVIKVQGQFYNLLFEKVDIRNMTIELELLHSPEIVDSSTLK